MRYLVLLLVFAFVLFFDTKAQLIVDKVFIDRKLVSLKSDTINLRALESDLIIEFLAPSDDSMSYKYLLKQVEKDSIWTESRYPTAHFQNLKGGNYIFKIINTNNNELKTIAVNKETVFWNEWWFWPSLGLYFLVLLGIGIYLFFLYNFRQKLKIHSIRNQIAADLHDEVGSNLNSISIFVEVLKQNASTDILPFLEKIITNSRESVSLMQDTVWMVNPQNDSLEKLISRMESFASQLLAGKNISLDFETINIPEKSGFSMVQRKNCFLIFKEAVNNIAKHSEAKKVEVTIKYMAQILEITIKDDGIGFDLEGNFEGNGLQNFKTRALEASFKLEIVSGLNNGTFIKMRIFNP